MCIRNVSERPEYILVSQGADYHFPDLLKLLTKAVDKLPDNLLRPGKKEGPFKDCGSTILHIMCEKIRDADVRDYISWLMGTICKVGMTRIIYVKFLWLSCFCVWILIFYLWYFMISYIGKPIFT